MSLVFFSFVKRTHFELVMGDSAALWAAAKAGNEAEVEDILTNKQSMSTSSGRRTVGHKLNKTRFTDISVPHHCGLQQMRATQKLWNCYWLSHP